MAYTCPNCGKVCAKKYGLTNHMKNCTTPQLSEEIELNRQGEDADIGAFMVVNSHLAVLLDLNFCSALGRFILEHDSTNKAILAFGHRLMNMTEDHSEG